MSLIGSVANYGGKQPDNSQNIKQFVVEANGLAFWIYKTTSAGLKVQTPGNKTIPVYINSDLYVNGSIFNTSDVSLKENIETISESKVNNLLNLNPVKYTFKSDVKKKIHYGFIAQEIEGVYPELVKLGESGHKTVNYIELIPMLVSKINAMQKEIDDLKKIIQKDI
jgi:hypothetical protein